MPCFHPLKAWKYQGQISFKKLGTEALQLPCGQCIGCRIEKSRQWAVRCVHEAQLHKDNSFITLTYDNENLPKHGTLVVKDWQNFAKKLRKKIGPFRFFHCGEYGELTQRPHYHACLFGHDFHEDRELLTSHNDNRLYTSELLTKTWGKGYCTVGNLTYQSAAYVSRYILKKITGPGAEAHYGKKKPEYITMSRRPGIAAKWYEKYKGDVYPSDEVILRGKRFRPPRFYDNQLPEKQLETLKEKRLENVKNRGKDLTPARLTVREKVLQNKITDLNRKL